MSDETAPPILGLGNDIVEIERVRQAIKAHGRRFLNRLFTPKEQQYCSQYKDPIPNFAGRFAAKEAIAKALGTGIGSKLSWLDMEILGNAQGKPEVAFSSAAKKRFKKPLCLISISHSKLFATAVAIWVKE